MPYRRLPNTDQARLRALQTAVLAGQKKSPEELAFSSNTLSRLRAFFTTFETTIIHHKLARQQQEKSSGIYQEAARKARLYLSHFMQIVNFSMQRGDIKPDAMRFYGIGEDKKMPSLVLDSELLEWGKKILEGEQKRVLNGGNPIYNPSIAMVKVKFDQFIDAYHFQKTLQNNTARWTSKVVQLREEADAIILEIWNEVEDHFSSLPDEMKREEATKYGVTYVYRPMERIKTASPAVQTSFMF